MLHNSRRQGLFALMAGLWLGPLGCDPNLPREVPVDEPVERVPEPVVTVEGEASRNLLQQYIERDPEVVDRRRACPEDQPGCAAEEQITLPVTWEDESQTWKLPYQAKRVVVSLVIAAAHDRRDSLRFILTPEAQWGWPDPRRPGARPVFAGDEGEEFFQALRKAAQRLPGKVKWKSIPVPPGIQMLHATGAEPMWTYYAEGRDGIMMRLVMYGGKARIDYVGLFEEFPEQRPTADAYGPPPPLAPPRLGPPGE